MDSKLRRMAILASMGVMVLVALLVFYANSDKSGNKHQGSATSLSGVVQSDGTIGNTTGQDSMQTAGQSTLSGYQTSVQNGQIGNDLKAFLEDNTFFDEEVNPIAEAAEALKKRLSLITTSVEKDLRVQIVDSEGIPVVGESFYVKLEGLGEYKDLDRDGVIYIGDLDSGDYSVALLPIEGYKVPSNTTRVRVKEKVEYVAIDDISLLIKTEDEVDAENEDTAVQDSVETAAPSEIKDLRKPTSKAKAGIDVSKWNKEIDWVKVKEDGVEFAIIRAGYRGSSTGSLVEDPYFRTNMEGAIAAGIEVGVYFFTQAINEVEAVEEASAVLEMVRGYNLDFPIFIDTEGAGGNGRADKLDVETRTLVCEAFCRTVENAGSEAGVYASRNWYKNNLKTERLEDYFIWLAEYRETPLYTGYYRMWQYTSKGKVAGIEGNVDLNIAYE